MENNHASEKKNKRLPKKGLLGILATLGALGNTALNFMGKGIKFSQIINFINAWPVVVIGVAICLAYVIVERDRQQNKTERAKYNSKDNEQEILELKEKVKQLENELTKIKKERDQIALENGELKIKLEYMEKDVERLRQNNRAEVLSFNILKDGS